MSDFFYEQDEPDLRAMWQAIRDGERRKRSRLVWVGCVSLVCVVAIAGALRLVR